MIRRCRGDEHGAASVLALALVAVLVLAAVAAAGAVGIVLAHRRAQSAADLAALAAAQALQRGEDPCAAAGTIAQAHRTRLTSCGMDGEIVVVTASVELPPVLGGSAASGRARAGPAQSARLAGHLLSGRSRGPG